LIPPKITSLVITNGTNLQLKAGMNFGGNYYLLAGTNLSQPFNEWLAVTNYNINNRYPLNVTLTNGVNSGFADRFYILRTQ
jgi:hypothetical protein